VYGMSRGNEIKKRKMNDVTMGSRRRILWWMFLSWLKKERKKKVGNFVDLRLMESSGKEAGIKFQVEGRKWAVRLEIDLMRGVYG
jgi:hypothetical protein